MRKLPDTTGFIGYGETSWETGGPSETSAGKIYKDLIRKANTVPLSRIFRHYNLRIDKYNRNVICPFKSHKGGRESTPSFNYYPDTDSFRCFGCKKGHENAHGPDFIAAMEGISKGKAAYKVLQLFQDFVKDDDGEFIDYANPEKMLEVMLDFSNTIRDFRDCYSDKKSQLFIENICQLYDDLYARQIVKSDFKLEALTRSVEMLKEKIINYKPCLTS